MENEEISLRLETENQAFLFPVSSSAGVSPWNEDVLSFTENIGCKKSSRGVVDDSSKKKHTDAVSSKYYTSSIFHILLCS